MVRHKYFLDRSSQLYKPEALIVPEMPLQITADLEQGRYYLGDMEAGSELELFALRFSHRLSTSDCGFASAGALMGELWFSLLSGSRHLPTNLTYYMLLANSKSGKRGGLMNFQQQATIAMSRGYDFREVVWMPRFVKRAGFTFYALLWQWREPILDELKKLDSCVDVLESEVAMGKLHDPALEATSRCVDGMSQDEIEQLAKNLRRYR